MSMCIPIVGPAADPEKWAPRWGNQTLGALTERAPCTKRAYKVHVKITNCLKKQPMQSKGFNFKNTSPFASVPPKR